MATTAAIFPGQGAQLVGMGKDVAARFSAAADTFSRADEILGFELSRLCFEGPEERLSATDIQHPARFVTSVALHRPAPSAAPGLPLPRRGQLRQPLPITMWRGTRTRKFYPKSWLSLRRRMKEPRYISPNPDLQECPKCRNLTSRA